MIDSSHRFHGRSSLRFVYQRGQIVRGPLVAVRYVRNDRQPTYRMAVVVSRKVSKSAVVRNRIRRRLYEIVRKHAEHIVAPYDLLVSVYGDEVAKLSHANLQRSLLGQLHRAGVLNISPTEAEHATIQNVLKSSVPTDGSPEQNKRKREAAPAESAHQKESSAVAVTHPDYKKETNN